LKIRKERKKTKKRWIEDGAKEGRREG